MKKFFLLSIIALAIVLVSCSNDNEVEVIPDYDQLYLGENKVDISPKIIGDEEKLINSIFLLTSNNFSPESNAFYLFGVTMFISESGELEKIKYNKIVPENFFKDAIINPNIEMLFNQLTPLLKDVEFSPAMLNEKSVKAQYYFDAQIKVDSSGKSSIFSGSLGMAGLKNLRKINKKQFVEKVSEMPIPIGGMNAIAINVHYPEIAKRAGIQGRVFVKAFIDEEGNVAATEIIKGIGSGCDQAAIEAIQKTKFHPGKENGKPVKVQVSIPIMFKLN